MYKYYDINKLCLAPLSIAALVSCAQVPSILPQGLPYTSGQTTTDAQQDERDLTPKHRELRTLARQQEEQAEAFNKTIMEGAAIGALIGATVGALTGDTGQDRLKRAAIGGVAGAAAGALAGKYVAYKQQQYTNREDQLNSMIADVRQLNQENQVILNNMREVLAENKSRIADLEKQYERKKISREQYQRELAAVKSDRRLMNGMVQKAEQRLAIFKEAGATFAQTNPGVNVNNYDREVENSQETIDAMHRVVNDLATV
jgi:uncharacterized protein YcfJ